jgi:chemotaxis response regulator CheB
MKALVVDDSALMRRQIGDILTRGGLQVTTARTGAEALVRIAQDAPDVVTLDINMPEMDGLTCLSRIMAECPLPVVMISSLTERGALATLEAIALGAVDFVHKPGGTVSTALRDQEDQIIAKVLAAAGASVRRASGLRQRLVARRDAIMRAPRARARAAAAMARGTRRSRWWARPPVARPRWKTCWRRCRPTIPCRSWCASTCPPRSRATLPSGSTSAAPCRWRKCAARPSCNPARSTWRGAMPT